ncbi:MAG: PAS domain S-box protein [Deltaproteobacteria bacterium]|nr:PAS domain S-box protein [Deltaproteobacteria bacterium]
MDLQEITNSPNFPVEILSSIQHPVIVTDLEGEILFANPVIHKVLGYDPDELKGKSLSFLFTPEDLTYLYPNLLFLARQNKSFEGELMLMRKDGSRFFAFMVLRACADKDQGRTTIVFSIHDIDKLKQIEKAFRVNSFEDLAKVADGIAHEIRNPLVGIGGLVNRLYKSCNALHEHGKYYDFIIDNLNRIETLIKKVEFFARLPQPRFKVVPIRELINSAVEPYLGQIEKRNVDLKISIEKSTLCVDASLVARAVSIIIENTLDALSEGGRIKIHSEMKENQCIIYIRDTGSGIKPEDIPYIFNPFFSTKADGTGIDLAVVKRILESHGGHVEVRSEPGKGTTFFLTFPLERRRAIRISRLEDAVQGMATSK